MRIQHQLQIGERVLDFLPLVEADATDDLVGNAGATQRIFQCSRLGVGSIQDRDQVLDVVVKRGSRRPRDEFRLVEIISRAVVADLRPALPLGIEALILAVAVLRDHRRRRIEDDLRGAVVPFELDDAGFGEVVFEVEDVAQVGAAPFVDRLVGIADDTQVAMLACEPLDEQVLRPIGVLILVHHHVHELVRVLVADGFRLLEQLHRLQQQVVEVERVGVAQCLRVELVELPDVLLARVPGVRGEGFGAFHAVLRMADSREREPRRHGALVGAHLPERLLHHRELVGRIVDDEVTREADVRRLAAQQARAERVERGDPHPFAVHPQQRLDARAHLLRGFVGERDREQAIGLAEALADEIRDAVRDDARLAGARAGKNQQRARAVEDGFLLFRIESGKKIQPLYSTVTLLARFLG